MARMPTEQVTDVVDGIVARSPVMRGVIDWIAQFGPTDLTVLLTGETGTGKELVARALHQRSRRSDGPFVAINCGGVPEALVEAELFGYQKGAFTSASAEKAGLFEAAHGGTLLLDEIGEMPLAMQVRLLRVLEDGEVRRLGQTRSRRVNVRVIAATNRNLRAEIAAGRCRADLYFRLSAAACHIAPLRERPEDLEALVAFWIAKLAASLASPARAVSPDAMTLLRAYPWPGNVRELRHVLEHALVIARDELITAHDLAPILNPPIPRAGASPSLSPSPFAVALPARGELLAALETHRWNRNRAAASLGISRSTLWRRLRRHGLANADENENENGGER